MGSEFTVPEDRPPTPRLNDCTFAAFLHDVHHAYLLLHRALKSIPPTVIPDLEPMPGPCLDDMDQPDPLRPVTISSPVPSPTDEEAENDMFNLVAGQDLPHRVASAKVPPPVRHLAAPDPSDLPLASTGLSKSPIRSPPAAPPRRRRSTGSKIDKAAAARDISRSRSPSRMTARPWGSDETQKLRALKEDNKARHSWKTVAGKLARSVDDCKLKWRLLNGHKACK